MGRFREETKRFEKREARFVLTSRLNGDSLYTNVSASSLIGYACDVSRVSRQPARGWTSENCPSRRTFFCLIVAQKFLDFRSNLNREQPPSPLPSVCTEKLYVREKFFFFFYECYEWIINRRVNKDTYVSHVLTNSLLRNNFGNETRILHVTNQFWLLKLSLNILASLFI